MKLTWTKVFMFGAAYNAIIEQSVMLTLLCLGVVALLPTLDKLDRRYLG